MDDVETLAKPLSALEEKDLLLRIQRWHRNARDGSGKWREENRENFDFVAGKQWEDSDVANLKKLLRPCLSFNRIGPIIDSVSGMEVNNRQEVRYIPRTEGDEAVNELFTGAAQWVRDQCDAEDEESDAFIDLLICGMGWTETRIEYETDPDGAVRIERVDPFEMYWDRSARRRNLDDARYCCRLKEMDIADARGMFPDASDEDLHAAWTSPATDESQGPINREEARYYEDGKTLAGDKLGKVRVLEAQWWETEPFWRAINPMSGEIEDVTEEDYKLLKERFEGQPFQAVKQKRRVYKRAFVGAKVLEAGEGPCKDAFTYRCMTGKRDRNTGDWYGLVKAMKDPQRFANKFMSSILHTIATSGKGILAETDSFDDPRTAEEDWAHPDKIVWMKSGTVARGAVIPKPGSQIPAGLPEMMVQAITAIRDVAGVNLEFIAAADKAQSGVLEYQRKQAAMTVLATLFDSLRRYRKEQGRVLLYFIQKYLTDGRLVRISGEDKIQYVPLTKQEGTVKYDVIVDQQATSPNQKEATWAIIGQLMPTLMKLPLPPDIWVELVKYSPLPESFAQKVRKSFEQQAQNPPPDPAMIKLENDKAAKDQELEHDRQKNEADIAATQQKFDAEAKLKREIADIDADIEWNKMQAQIGIEREKAQAAIEIEREKAAAQLQIEAMKCDSTMQITERKANQDMEISAETALAKSANEQVSAKPDKNGKQPAVAGPMVQILRGLVDGQKLLAEAITAPKTVTTPDGRTYTSRTVN